MKKYIIILVLFSSIGCSKATKKQTDVPQRIEDGKKSANRSELRHSNWLTFKDTINTGFAITFKYPKNLFAEHFENAECIGNKIKIVDDGPLTTMDCCIWMEEAANNSIEEDLDFTRKAISIPYIESADSVLVANNKALRIRFYDKSNRKLLKDNLYFQKFGTLFSINNKRLSNNDFEYFLKSIEIER